MAVRSGVIAVVASVLLAGCATAPAMPEPMTQAEAQRQIDESNRFRWDSMFPGDPMPEVAPVKYLEAGGSWTEVTDCLREAHLNGVTVGDDGSITRLLVNTPESDRAMKIAQFVCHLKYPVDVSDPGKAGYLTQEQTDWIWQYNQTRFLPCVQQLGYTVLIGLGDDAPGFWYPYFDISPRPTSDREWALIELHCPPSPIGPVFRPLAG